MSPVTDDDVRVYTQGQCWVLAWHLLQEIPAQYAARIIDLDEHVLVQLGTEDRYLDVTGVHTKAELGEIWPLDRMHPIAYDLGAHILPDSEHPENVRARRVARALVARYLTHQFV